MTFIPLDIPAGFYRNGTDYEQSNRWREGSLVRWRDNSLRPIGGWQERKASFSTNPVRGMHTWVTNADNAWLAGGSHSELKVMTGGGTITDITPSDLATGREDAAANQGFGGGTYGSGYFGNPRQINQNSVLDPATTWSLDNWGEYLLAVHSDDGRLLEWQLDTATNAAVVSNAPTGNLSALVTEERFVFCLGAGGNGRKVQWSDREDNTTWTPAATNEAGDIELQTSGQIMQGVRTRGQTLILTDVDAHRARYLGPPYVYGFERVGTSCGSISAKAAADIDMGVFWMGQKGFFRFDGNGVSELPCDVHDYVFDDFNVAQQSKVWALANAQYGEIWWFYCSSDSLEIDRYVAFDYMENHWLIGELSRTSGVQRGVFRYPFMAKNTPSATVNYTVTVADDSGNKYYISGLSGSAPELTLIRGHTYVFDMSDSSNTGHPFAFRESDDTSYTDGVTSTGTAGSSGAKVTIVVADDAPDSLKYYCTVHGNGMGNTITVINPVDIMDHEVGYNFDTSTSFAETGPISIGVGENLAKVTKIIPDEKTQGDVSVTFKTRLYPNATETTHGPFTPSNPTSVRFTGRQLRMRVEGEQPTKWNVGTMRIDAIAGGRR